MTGQPARPVARRAVKLITMSALAGLLAGCASAAPASSVHGTVGRAPRRTGVPVRSSSASSTAPTAAQVRAQEQLKMAALIRAHRRGSISVAALDVTNGRSFSAGASGGMWTASAYKLFVLEAMLMRRQRPGSIGLSSYEIDSATRMIENSDNVAGYDLWEDAGGNDALTSAAYRLGMTSTAAGISDPAFTTTSGADALHLLEALLDKDGPLNAASRAFVLHLMADVEADQRWGVGAAADPGTDIYNKNGWLSIDDSNGPGEDDDGLWAVTSLGIITASGDRVLMAVLTRHNPSFQDGVDLVEALARPLARCVTG